MMLPEPNRRSFLVSALAVVSMGGYFRVVQAQSPDNVLDPILDDLVWRNIEEFRRFERLIWTSFELKYLYRDGFREATGLALPEPNRYVETVRRLTEKGPEVVPTINFQPAVPSFEAAFEQNGPVFLDWLETIGVLPVGLFATELMKGQALLSLLGLLFDGYKSLIERRKEEEDDCAIFYPFC